MPVERQSNSTWWYARVVVHGVTKCFNLGVRVDPQNPDKSKIEAEFRLRQIEEDLAGIETLVEALSVIKANTHIARSGHRKAPKVEMLLLAHLPDAWMDLPSRDPRKFDSRYAQQVRSNLVRFVDFIGTRFPHVAHAIEVTEAIARAYATHLVARNLAAKTYNDSMAQLRLAFGQLANRIGDGPNPFVEIPKHKAERVSRRPFNVQELGRIYEVALTDSFVGPIVLTAMFTALRRGDCCCLRWSDVDLRRNLVRTRTMKTDEPVTIPIFADLRAILEAQAGNDSEWVFPEQRQMYLSNPDGIGLRVKKLLSRAGFSDDGDDGTPMTIARKRGVRRASVRGLHAFRTTWATLALLGGLPESLLLKVTGHTDIKTVREHYLQPDDEATHGRVRETMAPLFSFSRPEATSKPRGTSAKELLGRIRESVQRMRPESVAVSRQAVLHMLEELEHLIA